MDENAKDAKRRKGRKEEHKGREGKQRHKEKIAPICVICGSLSFGVNRCASVDILGVRHRDAALENGDKSLYTNERRAAALLQEIRGICGSPRCKSVSSVDKNQGDQPVAPTNRNS